MELRYLLLLFYFFSYSCISAPIINIDQPTETQFPIETETIMLAGTAYSIPDNGLDLVIVIDDSGSIDDFEYTRDRSIKQLFCSMSQLAESEDVRASVVAFASEAEVLIPLTPLKDLDIVGKDSELEDCQQPIYVRYADKEDCAPSIDECISALDEEGGTSTDLAILQAIQVFLESNSEIREKRVLLFTDGDPHDSNAAVEASKQAAIQNIRVDIVGLGSSGELDENGKPSNEYSSNNNQIAINSAGGKLYSANQTDLASTFVQIALDIQDVIVTRNGELMPTQTENGLFSSTINLVAGGNALQVQVIDNENNISQPTTGYVFRGTSAELLENFINSTQGISLNADNVVSFTSLEGVAVSGFLGEVVSSQNPVFFTGSLRSEPTTDRNNDGINDFIIQYPNGDERIFYYFANQTTPSETALRNYLQAARISFNFVGNNRLNMSLNGEALQLQLDSNFDTGAPPREAELVFSSVSDLNSDGTSDYRIIYPNGIRQNVYDITPPPPPPITIPDNSQSTDFDTTGSLIDTVTTGDIPRQENIDEQVQEELNALVRGVVRDKSNQPLSNVTISVVDKPEIGSVRTSIDGSFLLAVVGGEEIIIEYQKLGFITTQRDMTPPENDVIWIDTVIMTPRSESQEVILPIDPNIDSSQTISSTPTQTTDPIRDIETDESRQITIVIPNDLVAEGTITRIDGTEETGVLEDLNLQITEITEEDNALEDMPLPLPENSGYTFAFEVTDSQAEDVSFNRILPIFVDNFLDLPVGTPVPVGRIDEAANRWEASSDGKVVSVLGADANGYALIDSTGDGQANSSQELSALGIRDSDRIALAANAVGSTYMVAPVNQLGIFDLNWALRSLNGLLGAASGRGSGNGNDIYKDPCEEQGCIIEIENQVLGETIPLTGIPFNLNYRSDRTPGRTANYSLDIPLQDEVLIASEGQPKRIELSVQIGGQRINKTFSNEAKDNPDGVLETELYTLEWDGRDSFGRVVQGGRKAYVQLDYVYNGQYVVPPEVTNGLLDSGAVECSTEIDTSITTDGEQRGSFGCIQTGEIPPDSFLVPARQEVKATQNYSIDVGNWFPKGIGLGGMTIDIHHAYDVGTQILYRGDGGERQIEAIERNSKLIIASLDGSLVYEFSKQGRHIRTLDALTRNTLYRFGYNEQGYLLTITDIEENEIEIERDTNNQPLAIISAYKQRTELGLDVNGYLNFVSNPAGEIYRLTYQDNGLLIGFIDPVEQVATYEYDSSGYFVRDTDPAGGGWQLERQAHALNDDSGVITGHVTTMTSAENRTSTYNTTTVGNSRERFNTSPDGSSIRTVQSANNLTKTTYSSGAEVSLQESLDPRFGEQALISNIVSTKTPNGLTTEIVTNRYVELENPDDPLSLTAFSEITAINGKEHVVYYNNDLRQKVVASPTGRTKTSFFDEQGRLTSEQVPKLATTNYRYDERGRLVETIVGEGDDARRATLTYDDSGYVRTLSDALEREIRFEYDAVGRVIAQTLADGREVEYTYDANSNMTAITPPGKSAHAFSYTPVNLQAAYTPPALDGIETPASSYEYNLDKQLVRMLRPDGQEIKFDYVETTGQLEKTTYPHGEELYQYDADSNLTHIVGTDGSTLSYTYDGSLALSETWGNGQIVGHLSHDYDNDLRLVSSSINGTHTVNYRYDDDGLLLQAGFLSLEHDAENGMLLSRQLGDIETTRRYNVFGEVVSEVTVYQGEEIYRLDYEYDKLSRITGKTEVRQGTRFEYAYSYDLAGRLTEVVQNGVVVESYVYDDNGNRLEADTAVQGSITAEYDAQDRLLRYADANFTYTANGELLTREDGLGLTAYEYDVLGNLRRVELSNGNEIEYLIDGRNRRVGKLVNGAFVRGWLYEGTLNPIAEVDAQGNITARFVYGSQVNVPDYIVKGERIYRVLTDQLGSPTLVVDIVDGSVVQQLRYDAFGNVIEDSNPTFQPFGFAGGLYDVDTGLVRFGARDYDAKVGRWTAKDPIGFEGGDSNLYGYVVHDPVNLVDPTGELFFIPFLIGAATGAGLEYLLNPCASTGDILLSGAIGAIGGGGSGAYFLRFHSKALTREIGKVWSHSISRKNVDRFFSGRLNKILNKRGGINGSWVNKRRHHLHDKSATILGGGRKLPLPIRFLDRIPDWLKGAAVSGGVGAAIAGS